MTSGVTKKLLQSEFHATLYFGSVLFSWLDLLILSFIVLRKVIWLWLVLGRAIREFKMRRRQRERQKAIG